MDPILATQDDLMVTFQEAALTVEDTPEDGGTDDLLQSQLELLERYWAGFEANHIGLLQSTLSREHSYFSNKSYTQMEQAYVSARARIYDVRARLHPIPLAASTPVPDQPRGVTRLPRITIPTFNGRHEEWEPFRDLFKSLIHEDASLSDVDKFYYLKAHVQGEAKAALDSLPITGPSFSIAWRILESRYDNRRLLVQEHLKALKNLRPLRNESATNLQHLLDELTRRREQLRVLGCPVDSWDAWLVLFASEAMDAVTRRDWEEELEIRGAQSGGSSPSTLPTFAQCSAFLQRRCHTLRSLESKRSSGLPSGHDKNSLTRSTGSRGMYACVAGASTCPSCRRPHPLGHCLNFRQLGGRERRKFVIEERLCFNCLKPGHTAAYCPSTSSCLVCKGQHHTVLHDAAAKRARPLLDSTRPSKRARVETTEDPPSGAVTATTEPPA